MLLSPAEFSISINIAEDTKVNFFDFFLIFNLTLCCEIYLSHIVCYVIFTRDSSAGPAIARLSHCTQFCLFASVRHTGGSVKNGANSDRHIFTVGLFASDRCMNPCPCNFEGQKITSRDGVEKVSAAAHQLGQLSDAESCPSPASLRSPPTLS